MDDQRTDREGGGSLRPVKRLWFFIVLAVALAMAAALVFFRERLNRISEDFYFRNHRDTTVWAQGYSDAGFQKVHKGMARLKVIELLGPPLESKDEVYCRRGCDTSATQSWTQGQGNGAYRRRTIEYVNDYVVHKLSGTIDPSQK